MPAAGATYPCAVATQRNAAPGGRLGGEKNSREGTNSARLVTSAGARRTAGSRGRRDQGTGDGGTAGARTEAAGAGDGSRGREESWGNRGTGAAGSKCREAGREPGDGSGGSLGRESGQKWRDCGQMWRGLWTDVAGSRGREQREPGRDWDLRPGS